MVIEKGIIVSGEFGNILARQKSTAAFQLGELLVVRNHTETLLLQVYDLLYGSQLSQNNLELISGLKLEENIEPQLIDKNLRNYLLARLNSLLTITNDAPQAPKTLPPLFANIHAITTDDVSFLSKKPLRPLTLGKVRSGSTTLDVPVYVDGKKALSHHLLVSGTTGRGKSNLMKKMLWELVDKDYCGTLVLDPHDEYYGRTNHGLSTHPSEQVVYYTRKNPPLGTRTLAINIDALRPSQLFPLYDWSDAQEDAMRAYYYTHKRSWVAELIKEKPLKEQYYHESTIGVIKRRLLTLLQLHYDGTTLTSKGLFSTETGKNTLHDIVTELEQCKTVIIDTSSFSGVTELLVGSIIAERLLTRYKHYSTAELATKPIVSIVLEEAPRVIGKNVLERGTNIFSTIAREGRKFNIGLIAITQLPSLIPREILANMNTKLILGTELKPERQALIDSAAQDLSTHDRTIASLNKGEVIATSNFLHFAVPLSIELFEKKKDLTTLENKFQRSYGGFSP